MTKRIFRSICLVALGAFLASVGLFMGVLYDYFSAVQRTQLRMQTELCAQAVTNEGLAYFEGLDVRDYRITWISGAGEVLYDSRSDAAAMENHLGREEIQQALAEGLGESARCSATLLDRSLYCAKLLPDGTVLRLSIVQNSLLSLFLGMAQPICVIFVVVIALSLVFASRLSKKIVEPLNELDLDRPLNSDGYDELSPLLRRIDSQQKQIRRQSDELRQRQSEFETVTAGMREGIVLLNRRGTILSINPAAARLLGAQGPAAGRDILSVNRDLRLQELLHRSEKGEHAEDVIELDGGEYQVSAGPVVSEGETFGTALLLLDVGEKAKAEQMRREFTANVSHELKTPLQTISGSSELLANGVVKPEDVAGFGKRIYTEAQRMIRLVEDIIKLSHLDEGAGDMRYEDVELYSLAEDTLRSLKPEADGAKVALTLAGGPARLRGIPQLLEGIIFNLCDNAIKYNRENGSVSVEVGDGAEAVTLVVSDTGIGIPLEHQERIFERFYRVDKSRSKEVGGTGLGLSIVKHAAKLHGAAIGLSSTENVGTTFTVRFPKDR